MLVSLLRVGRAPDPKQAPPPEIIPSAPPRTSHASSRGWRISLADWIRARGRRTNAASSRTLRCLLTRGSEGQYCDGFHIAPQWKGILVDCDQAQERPAKPMMMLTGGWCIPEAHPGAPRVVLVRERGEGHRGVLVAP